MVGLFSWYSPPPGPDVVDIGVGFSRDGFQWVRPSRGEGSLSFIASSNIAGTWNQGNTQSAGGVMLIFDNQLWFYYSVRKGTHTSGGTNSTGLAVLRRDGFYSMDGSGTLITRPVTFLGKNLFVNAVGQVQAEILDQSGNPIPPFTFANSVPVNADSTKEQLTWKGVSDLSALDGHPVEFRFTVTNGSLYSFWVAPNVNGASNGQLNPGSVVPGKAPVIPLVPQFGARAGAGSRNEFDIHADRNP